MQHIDIRLKVHSLLRRKEEFYCLCFDWESREIVVHRDEASYVKELLFLKRNGMTKRAECYVKEPISVGPRHQYLLYLVSVGDFRKGKIVNGENPIAKGLGLCLFDYVYVFVEERNQVPFFVSFRPRKISNNESNYYKSRILPFSGRQS
jgi:hypothetical protein